MKKYIFAFFIGLSCAYTVSAQQLNSNQKKLKTDIFNYLKKEVSNLTDYSATELRFNLNGTTYFVNVSESDYSPMYVVLYAGFNIPDTYKKDIVALAAPTLNSYKGVKFYSGDDYIKLQAEMFMNDYKPFATSFHTLISVMSTIRDAFDDAYEKAKPNYTTSSAFTSAFKRQVNEYIWPYIKTATDKKLYVSKVSLNKDYTILDMISYNGGQYQWCSIEKNSYLLVNGKKYSLQKAENIAYSPSHTNYPNYQSGNNVSLSFKLYFTPIPTGTTEFDFYESASEGWNIRGITLENADIIPISNSLIETANHKWEAVSVQCQQHQTVIRKKVIPKTSPTWINSSQEEFIEDSDTGRKYYLIKSDIGFETDRRILKDKSEVNFYEVFPALPASVKRINISSGSQYYVKNLSIR